MPIFPPFQGSIRVWLDATDHGAGDFPRGSVKRISARCVPALPARAVVQATRAATIQLPPTSFMKQIRGISVSQFPFSRVGLPHK